MIILVGGQKGGSGKSCIAQNITVCLAQAGYDVHLVDADEQETTYLWCLERQNNPELTPVTFRKASGDLSGCIDDLKKRYQAVVIDAAGRDSAALRSAMLKATHLLIPLRPKRRDLKTLPHVKDLVDLSLTYNPSMKVATIITQCPSLPSQISRITDAKTLCGEYGLPSISAITYQRNIYDDAEENGMSVMEHDVYAAKAEIHEIVTEFLGV